MGDIEQQKISSDDGLVKKGNEEPMGPQEPIVTDVSPVEKTDVEPVVKKSKGRKRKKVLHTAIRNQMEFYFSDANISKDRFMQTAIKDGPVPLEIFMNFNKLRAITEDQKEIVKALKFSTVLKLNEDETKVFRITPVRLRSQEEVDHCTIYVENLPPHATIEWITDIFSEFGSVAYVSLPKFKDGYRIKGFAFVEFNDAESAVKSVKAYLASNAYSSFEENPGKLCSIQAFNAETNQENFEENLRSPKHAKEGEDGSEPNPKKRKIDEGDRTTEESVQTLEDQNETNTEKLSTETCQKPTKKKTKPILNLKKEIMQEAQTLPLQVMSKKEWKKLRNKYLDMQRKYIRRMRMNSRRQQWIENHNEPIQDAKEFEKEQESVFSESKEEVSSNDFQRGVILKITLDEPISDAKRFKSQVKCQEGVTYVEAQDCSSVAFVRCLTAEIALSLLEKKIWAQTELLQDDEEREYWKKIEENRLKKRDRASKPKKSGAERARQKKETTIDADQAAYPTRAIQHKNLHIRFDDNDE